MFLIDLITFEYDFIYIPALFFVCTTARSQASLSLHTIAMPIIKIDTPSSLITTSSHPRSSSKVNGDSKAPAHVISTAQPNNTFANNTQNGPLSPTKLFPTKLGECYGKIADLEQHVPAKWWTSLFADALYLKTDGDVVEDPLITRHEANQLLSDTRISKLLASASETSRLHQKFEFM